MTKVKDRFSDSIASKFTDSKGADCLILKSESDVGVRRNLGRNGTRYAPRAIENTFKKLNHHLPIKTFNSRTVSFQAEELRLFTILPNNFYIGNTRKVLNRCFFFISNKSFC